MSVLSVRQPFAWAIIAGQVRIWNQTWKTDYRGPLHLHAGPGTVLEASDRRHLKRLKIVPPPELPRNVVLGTVDLVDVVAFHPRAVADHLFDEAFDEHGLRQNPLATGPWVWILANPRPLDKPIPHTTHPDLYRSPADRFTRDTLVVADGLTQSTEC